MTAITKRSGVAGILLGFAALTWGGTGVLAAEGAPAEDAALRHARELLSKHPLIDGHNDLPAVIRDSGNPPRDVIAYDLTKRTAGDTDLARLREGGVGGQFWSVFVPITDDVRKAGFAKVQLEQIDIAHRIIERYPKDLSLALTAADIESANAKGRIASLLGIEGGHTLENSLGALRTYYRLGVRYMTLTHFKNHDWADSATDRPRHGGLTRFGKEVVREMNRLGMLVDLSHVSADTMNDALDIVEAPVIFSHSNARALTDHPRDVPDQVLRRLPSNGGLVMASFVSEFNVQGEAHEKWAKGFAEASGGAMLGDDRYDEEHKKYKAAHPEPKATSKDVADHIEHIRKVAGVDHVGIGADFFGVRDMMVSGLEDTSKYPYVFAELIRRGWNDADLIKLARGNLLRALRGAEKTAARLQAVRPASYATIEQLDQGQTQYKSY